jgi:hypothetical protein
MAFDTIRVFLEKHNGNVRGGSWFRTRKGVLIGRGVPAKTFRGEECEVPLHLWENPDFRKDVYGALRLPGYQVVPRFEMVQAAVIPAEPKPAKTPGKKPPAFSAD